jgi:hypothetical protein
VQSTRPVGLFLRVGTLTHGGMAIRVLTLTNHRRLKMSNKELINVLLEVSRHSDSLIEYVPVDDNDLTYDEHDRIIRLVNDTVAKYEGVEDA